MTKRMFLSLAILLFQPFFAKAETLTQTTLPLRFMVGSPPPYLEATTVITIEGKSFPIIVDTGDESDGLILSKKVLSQIKVKYTGKKICFLMVEGKYCQPEYIVPEIKLGDFSIKNVNGVEMPEGWKGEIGLSKEGATPASLIGAIGLPLLSQFNLLLDSTHSKMILSKSNNEPRGYHLTNWISIPYYGKLRTKLIMDGHPLVFMWDTGAMPAGINRSLVKYFTQSPCPADYPNASDPHCAQVESSHLTTTDNQLLPNVWFDLYDLSNLKNMPKKDRFDGFMGSNFYAENQVYFDFDHQLIKVNPEGKLQ